MTMEEADRYRAPKGWEADLRSVVIGRRRVFFFILSRGKERRYVVDAKGEVW